MCEHLTEVPTAKDCPFRLFTLDDFTPSGAPILSVLRGPRSHNVGYHAISYTWNNEQPSMPIICDGEEKLVTSSLCDVLRQIDITGGRGHPHWVDQICIDQQDHRDKALQIPLISTIFGGAEKVMIWLGQSSPEIDIVFTKFDELCRFLWESDSFVDNQSDTGLANVGLPSTNDPFWQGICQIMSKPWFNRLWTVQEAALAKQAFFVCGVHNLDHSSLARVMRRILSRGLHTLLLRNPITPMEWDPVEALISQEMLRLVYEQGLIEDAILPILLLSGRRLQVSLPIDRSYGIIGMFKKETRAQIQVNYTDESRQHYWHAYIDLCHLLLHQKLGYLVLTEAASKERLDNLPSWCPNFNSPRPNGTLYHSEYCTGGSELSPSQSFHIATSIDRSKLVIRGLEIDQIHNVVPPGFTLTPNRQESDGPNGKAAETLRWLRRCIDITLELSTTPTITTANEVTTTLDSLTRALVGNYLRQPDIYNPPATDLDAPFQNFLTFLADKTSPGGSQQMYLAEPLRAMWRYLRQVSDTCFGRSVFTTTHGRIGVGPADIKPGDRVVILRGCGLPIILRSLEGREEEGQGKMVELVGEVYLHGIMNGEMARDGIDDEEDVFTLV